MVSYLQKWNDKEIIKIEFNKGFLTNKPYAKKLIQICHCFIIKLID